MSEWLPFNEIPYTAFNKFQAPFDGNAFLACIDGDWVGQAVYARDYYNDSEKVKMKYGCFFVTIQPENEGWKIDVESDPFPITHWMPLPEPPKEKNE